MKLKIKELDWNAGMPVAMLNDVTAKKLGVRPKDRISIKKNSKELFTIVDIVGTLIKENEIALSSEIKHKLKLKKRQEVDVNLAMPTDSVDYIKKKLNNKKLNNNEIKIILNDIVNNSLSEAEIAMFVSAMYLNGMNFNETIYLIENLVKTGHKLDLNRKLVVDKHSIGGIPGRVTPIVVSICAAAGLTMPKTSSRAITSSAGTADVMETIAKVDFSPKELEEIIKKTGGSIVWGGGLNMVPADNRIIQVEKMLKIDPESQVIASIMSKKLAVGSNYIVLHFPYGKYAKLSKERALNLKKRFEKVARYFNKRVKCVLTHVKGPYGDGVGPVLEMIDVIKVLDPEKKAPKKLENKSIELAGALLELTKKAPRNQGKQLARKILFSGEAFSKFKEIVIAQKGDLTKINTLSPAKNKKTFYSKENFKIIQINNKEINSLARVAGCPTDKSSGIFLHIHEGNKIKKGDKLLTIYAESKSRLEQAEKYYLKKSNLIFEK